VQVIGAPYLGDGKTWGGKGYEWNLNTDRWVGGKFVEPDAIKNGYWYWNNKEDEVMWGRGLDCSGLSFWAFNKAAGATKMVDSSNPICSDRASEQWKDTPKFEQLSTKIPTVSDLEPGYLSFIDANSNGLADHVGMYVGNGEVVHSKWGVGVKKKTLKDWLDIPVTGGKYKDFFVGFGRVKQTSSLPDHEPKQNTIHGVIEEYTGKFKSALYTIYGKIEERMSPVIRTAGESVILFFGYALL
jgi:cell wall-associated NlpC family hydrolase